MHIGIKIEVFSALSLPDKGSFKIQFGLYCVAMCSSSCEDMPVLNL
jgi:hypothetical protein